MAQRHVHSHLVTVEVGVEGRRDQRVQLNSLAFDQTRLEGLNTKAVECRSTVEEDRMTVDDGIEDVPHFCCLLLYLLLGALDRLAVSTLDQLTNDKGLEQLHSHVLRQAALVQLEFRTNDDHRTTRIVDALTEQVLTEAAGLALERIGERLECALRFAAHGAA